MRLVTVACMGVLAGGPAAAPLRPACGVAWVWGSRRADTSREASMPAKAPCASALATSVTVCGLPGGVVSTSPCSRKARSRGAVAWSSPEKR